jgi:hypothetical protein
MPHYLWIDEGEIVDPPLPIYRSQYLSHVIIGFNRDIESVILLILVVVYDLVGNMIACSFEAVASMRS